MEPKSIAEFVNEIGFEAEVLMDQALGKADLSIYGMACASCARTIEKEVKEMGDIQKVSYPSIC